MDWLKPLNPRGEASAGDNNDTQVAWLRVLDGQPSPGQIAVARKVFAAHLADISLSLAGYHAVTYTMPDGSRLRIVSNSGIHHATLRVAAPEPAEAYCGFVIKPKTINGATFADTDSTGLLRWQSSAWAVWVRPYAPGSAGATPTYFVDSIRSGRAGPPRINSDTSYYNDVISFSNDRLFKNGQPKGVIPSAPGAFPVLLNGKVLFAISDSAAGRISSPTTIDSLFAWSPTISPSALRFDAGVRYTHADDLAEYLALGLTTAGALQIRRAALSLLAVSPWATSSGTLSDQVDVPGLVTSGGGYTGSYSEVPSGPIYPLQDVDAHICGWLYPSPALGAPPTAAFSSNVIGSGLGTTDLMTHSLYSRTIDGSVPDVDLFGDITTEIRRSVTVVSDYADGNVFWMNKWPGPRLWTASSFPADGAEAALYGLFLVPAIDINSPSVVPDDLTNIATQEIGGILEESDVSFSDTRLSSGQVIFRSDVEHSVDHTEVTAVERTPDTPPATASVGTKIYYEPPTFTLTDTGWDAIIYPTQTILPDLVREDRVETLVVAAEARDYIYFDRENEVYVWFESVLDGLWTATYSKSGATTSTVTSGHFILAITLKASSPAGTFTGTELTISKTDPVTANLVLPPGIVQPSVNRTWRHVSPRMGYPIFAPRWMEQGACPYIAYTTISENAVGAAKTPAELPRFLASFRLQISLLSRPPLADLTPIDGAAVVRAPMMEQLLEHHWSGIAYTAFSAIEAQPFVLNASKPGASVHTDIGIIGTNPNSEFYRA